MSRGSRFTHLLTVSTAALALAIPSQAGVTRTFVATTGNDSNTSVNCSPTAPCRTFTAALSVTNSGGEIVVLNSGGYGPATIAQAVTITAVGVDASISVTTAGANGLTINTSGNVTLVGLNLHGEATGHDGILVQKVGFLRLFNMLIENFTNHGVDFGVFGSLSIYRSALNDNTAAGVAVGNVSSFVLVNGSSFDHNGNGVTVSAGNATVVNSSVSHSANTNAFLASGGALTLFNDRVLANNIALGASSGGTLFFSNCFMENNTTAYDVGAGGSITGTSPGTSLIEPGQTTSGSLATAVALQ